MGVTWAPHPQTYNMTHYQGHCLFVSFPCQRALYEPILNNNGNGDGNGNGSAGADMGLDCRAQLRAVASLTACRKGRVMQKWIDISPLTWHSRIHIHQARRCRCMLVLLSIGVAEFVKLPRRFIALDSSRPLCSSACSINSIFPSTPDSRPTTTIFSRHHLAEESLSFFAPFLLQGKEPHPTGQQGQGQGPDTHHPASSKASRSSRDPRPGPKVKVHSSPFCPRSHGKKKTAQPFLSSTSCYRAPSPVWLPCQYIVEFSSSHPQRSAMVYFT